MGFTSNVYYVTCLPKIGDPYFICSFMNENEAFEHCDLLRKRTYDKNEMINDIFFVEEVRR